MNYVLCARYELYLSRSIAHSLQHLVPVLHFARISNANISNTSCLHTFEYV